VPKAAAAGSDPALHPGYDDLVQLAEYALAGKAAGSAVLLGKSHVLAAAAVAAASVEFGCVLITAAAAAGSLLPDAAQTVNASAILPPLLCCCATGLPKCNKGFLYLTMLLWPPAPPCRQHHH
jgi:hypothetical protein